MKPLYPADFNPPNHGKCEVCSRQTKAWGIAWLVRCPEHWQALMRL